MAHDRIQKKSYPFLSKDEKTRVKGSIYTTSKGSIVKWNGKRTIYLCEHGKRRAQCLTCGGCEMCEHGKRRAQCLTCGGCEMCEHGKRKVWCRLCNGQGMCVHDKRKSLCIICGGSETCNNSWCSSRRQSKYQGFCYVCFVNNPRFKDHIIVRNYKNKERAVADFVKNIDDTKSLSWVNDKIIDGGCSKRRPDILVDMGSHVIIIEVDEHQHTDYETTCEDVRNMQLWEDVQCRPIVFIRFNPDKYTKQGITTPSCWMMNKKGLCVLKQEMKNEWTARLAKLKESVIYWTTYLPTNILTVQYLFYDD